MAKRVYLQSAIRWALGIALLIGSPVFLYFAYSNEIGAITITEKSWTDYCNATSWDNPADIICDTYISFCVNDIKPNYYLFGREMNRDDVFWYPVNYDPYGRSTPYDFDPNVKDWKLQRSWGSGWRTIPLTKPCTGTWCGLSNSKDKRLFSVAWREGRCYDTRIRAIKEDNYDSIFWKFGDIDPIWFGTKIDYEQKCKDNFVAVIDYGTCQRDSIYINNITKKNETFKANYTCKIGTHLENKPICKDTGVELDGSFGKYKFDFGDFNFKLDNFELCGDSVYDGNGDGIIDSGESFICVDVRNLNVISELDSPGIKGFKIEKI